MLKVYKLLKLNSLKKVVRRVSASEAEEPAMWVSFISNCEETNRTWREIVTGLTEIIISEGRNSFTFI